LGLLALLIALGGNAFGQTNIWYPGVPTSSTSPSGTNWSFELGTTGSNTPLNWVSANAFTNQCCGFMSQAGDPTPADLAYAQLFPSGVLAAYITNSALANAIYGFTAAIGGIGASSPSYTFELFAGGAPAATGTGGGTALPIGAMTTPVVGPGSGFAPSWTVGGVEAASTVPAGTPVWLRITAPGGELGVDAVLGVEELQNGNGTPPGGAIPEPFTMGLVGSGLLGFALWRRRSR
jgi:hypothetical protein